MVKSNYKFWTQDEVDFLKENYGKIPTKKVAETMGRSINSIRMKLIKEDIRLQNAYLRIIDFDFSNLTKENLAYIAGFLDGEGVLGLYFAKNIGRYYPILEVCNTNKEIIEFIHGLIGGGLYLEKRPDRPYCKPYHKITIKGTRHIYMILRRLFPYLIAKRKNALLLMEYCERRELSPIHTQRDFDIHKELKKLNKRGL